MLPVRFLADHAQQGVHEGLEVLHLRLQFSHPSFHFHALLSLAHRASHLESGAFQTVDFRIHTLMIDGQKRRAAGFEGEEPPARIELATSSLPMRCYTPKPQWRKGSEMHDEYNASSNI